MDQIVEQLPTQPPTAVQDVSSPPLIESTPTPIHRKRGVPFANLAKFFVFFLILGGVLATSKLVQKTLENRSQAAPTTNTGTPTLITKKVLILDFNPKLENKGGITLRQYREWFDTSILEQQFIEDIQKVSGGYVKYEVIRQEIDDIPIKKDGFDYTDESYLACIENGVGCHQPDTADYLKILNQYDVCGKHNRGEIDELWMWGTGYFGFYEAAMAGPNAFFTNGFPVIGSSCQKQLNIMGFNSSRLRKDMLHSMAHRVEGTMAHLFTGWNASAQPPLIVTPLDEFTKTKKTTGTIIPGCGTVHSAFNSMGIVDYDYANFTMSPFTCRGWNMYPSAPQVSTNNCVEFGCNEYQYLKYWTSHLPKNGGTTTKSYPPLSSSCYTKTESTCNSGCGWYTCAAGGNRCAPIGTPNEAACGAYNPPSTIENNWWNYVVDYESAVSCLPPVKPQTIAVGGISSIVCSATPAQIEGQGVVWSEVPGATSYTVKVDDLSNGPVDCGNPNPGDACYFHVGNVVSGSVFFSIPSVQMGKTFKFSVQANSACGQSAEITTEPYLVNWNCSFPQPTPSPTPTPTPSINPTPVDPTNGTLISGPSCVNPNQVYTFITTHNDQNGYFNIKEAHLLINNVATGSAQISPVGAVELMFLRQAGTYKFQKPDGATWYPSDYTSNGYATSVSYLAQQEESGYTTKVTWKLKFTPAWQPELANIYLKTVDVDGRSTNFQQAGTVQIGCSSSPPPTPSPTPSTTITLDKVNVCQQTISRVNWNAYANATGYEVWRCSDNSGACTNFTKVATLGASAPRTYSQRLSANQAIVYRYKVRATTDGRASAFSNIQNLSYTVCGPGSGM